MNHHPSDDLPNPVPTSNRTSAENLNPVLQSALGCLDIKLEDELNRFRDKQASGESYSHQPLAVARSNWQQQPPDSQSNSNTSPGEIVRVPIAHSSESSVSSGEQSQSSPGGFLIIHGIQPPEANQTAITQVSYNPSTAEFVTHDRQLSLNHSSGGEIAPFDREYSASSQELLQQIQSGYITPSDAAASEPQLAPPRQRKLRTPLLIGSAAACVLAGGATYVYLNPAILAPLTASKPSVLTTTNSSLGQAIQSPNLAANEFTELNLSTIATIKLPTAATPANVGTTTPPAAAPTGAPVAIPFRGMNNAPVAPTATIVAQPRLADSLVRALLPPDFHVMTKQTRYPATPPAVKR